jgi:hypothetical protein
MYVNLLGYTDRRPADYPALDRTRLMNEAHQIARNFRSHFASYRLALAYGLSAAWKSAKVRREFQSLNRQASHGVDSLTSAQKIASRRAARSVGSSLWAS